VLVIGFWEEHEFRGWEERVEGWIGRRFEAKRVVNKGTFSFSPNWIKKSRLGVLKFCVLQYCLGFWVLFLNWILCGVNWLWYALKLRNCEWDVGWKALLVWNKNLMGLLVLWFWFVAKSCVFRIKTCLLYVLWFGWWIRMNEKWLRVNWHCFGVSGAWVVVKLYKFRPSDSLSPRRELQEFIQGLGSRDSLNRPRLGLSET